MSGLFAVALAAIPEVHEGDDLAALVAAALAYEPGGEAATGPASSPGSLPAAGAPLQAGDVLAVAHKVVSKAEGRVRRLADVDPGERARDLALAHGKDPRAVQVVLDESVELVRAQRGVLISRTHHGFVCANAGVDASNAGAPDTLVLLPRNPDASARRLRAGLQDRLGVAPGVVITDSFGRAWRHGQADVAIGCAGIHPLDDWRGRTDAEGRGLHATLIAVADLVAGTAELARAKDSRDPVVLVRGLTSHVRDDDGPGAAALVRAPAEDLFP